MAESDTACKSEKVHFFYQYSFRSYLSCSCLFLLLLWGELEKEGGESVLLDPSSSSCLELGEEELFLALLRLLGLCLFNSEPPSRGSDLDGSAEAVSHLGGFF